MIYKNIIEHTISIECDQCSFYEEYDLDLEMTAIIEDIKSLGWHIIHTNTGRKYLCPDCYK